MRVAVHGIAGRMGRTVSRLLLSSPEWTLAAGWEAPDSPWLGRPFSDLLGSEARGVITTAAEGSWEGIGIVIDFSRAEAIAALLPRLRSARIPLVTGTTGLGPEVLSSLREAAREIAIVQATNLSVGASALLGLLPDLARALGEGWDIEVVEHHHRGKRDAPSGTALRWAQALAEARGLPWPSAARHGRVGGECLRRPDEIGLHALRGGDTVGVHRVLFAGEGEEVEICHRVTSREAFARGALRAARAAAGSPPGLYAFEEILQAS